MPAGRTLKDGSYSGRVIDERWIYVGAVIGLLGAVAYARDTARGSNQPNRMTFVLWALAPLLGFGVQLRLGVGTVAVMTLVIGVGPLIILISSYSKTASGWKLGRFDYACGSLSAMGLAVWLTTGHGGASILLFVAADLLAGLPTIRKAWLAPHSESASLFLAGFVNSCITLATLDALTVETAAFPLYAFTMTSVLLVLIKARPRRPPIPKAT